MAWALSMGMIRSRESEFGRASSGPTSLRHRATGSKRTRQMRARLGRQTGCRTSHEFAKRRDRLLARFIPKLGLPCAAERFEAAVLGLRSAAQKTDLGHHEMLRRSTPESEGSGTGLLIGFIRANRCFRHHVIDLIVALDVRLDNGTSSRKHDEFGFFVSHHCSPPFSLDSAPVQRELLHTKEPVRAGSENHALGFRRCERLRRSTL